MQSIEKLSFGEVDLYMLRYDKLDIASNINKLFPDEQNQMEQFKHPKRKQQYLAVRLIKNEIFPNQIIQYSEIGSPFIDNEGYISISHSSEVAALACCPTFQIGLDLETIRKDVLRVTDKFLGREEKLRFDVNNTLDMIKIWSGKEALYKLSGEKGLIFANALRLHHLMDNDWIGYIQSDEGKRKVKMHIQQHQDFVISLNIEPIEIQ